MRGSWDTPDKELVFGKAQIDGESLALQHISMSQMCDLELITEEQAESFYKFAFVRNPWDRAVSDYAWHRKRGFEGGFRAFLEYIPSVLEDASTINSTNCHVMPQYRYIYNDEGRCLVDFVGRFENLDRDFKHVLGKLGLPSIALPKSQGSRHLPYPLHYTKASYRMVKRIYQEDIETFGYSFFSFRNESTAIGYEE